MPNLVNRQLNQAARIHAGVAQGQLTRGEAATARANNRAAHQQIAADRQDGQGLTRREWRQDQLMLSGNSQAIREARQNEQLRLVP